jgi:hypothetical protein
MDHFFRYMKLVSLEENPDTHRRQVFHQFSSRITLNKMLLGDYLATDYQPGAQDVFWLDYTELKYSLLEEFQTVLKAVPNGSVVRITLPARPEFDLRLLKGRVAQADQDRIREQMEKDFEAKFEKVLTHPVAGAFAAPEKFARMVQLMVQRAASTALEFPGSERQFLVVQSTRYNDGTQMVSVTGIVCGDVEVEKTKEILANVRFANFDWAAPVEINVPALSAKERLELERFLPVAPGVKSGEDLQPRLGYRIDNTDAESIRQLSQYADFHREFPQFVRVAI